MNQDTLGIIFRRFKKKFIFYGKFVLFAIIILSLVFPIGVFAQQNTQTNTGPSGENLSCYPYCNTTPSGVPITGPNGENLDCYPNCNISPSGEVLTGPNGEDLSCYPYCNTTPSGQPYTGQTPSSNSQAAFFINGAPGSGSNASSSKTTQAASLATCLGSKALGNFIKTKIGSVISHDLYTRVAITSTNNSSQAGDSTGFPPSWDSIAYCILNEIIAQIANATIAWINSGFNGNPAFISDPKRFFSDLANYEASSFIQQVAYGATGLNICQPFRAQIATGLNNAYNRGYGQASSCNLGTIGQNVQNFQAYTSGGAGSGSLNNLWQVGVMQQNPGHQYLLAQNELSSRIALQQNQATIDLSHGNGFLSYKECQPNVTTLVKGAPVTTPGPCNVTTPGTVIQQQLNNRLSSGNNRLILADKFDQVVDALVNQLIKTALNKVLQTTR